MASADPKGRAGNLPAVPNTGRSALALARVLGRWAQACLLFAGLQACGDTCHQTAAAISRQIGGSRSDEAWLSYAARVPLHGHVRWPEADEETHRRLTSLGFLSVGDGQWEHAAALHEEVPLVTMAAPSLPDIDAIAIVTIERPGAQTPYIYKTLESLLAEFPEETQVNVVVGDANDAFVSAQKLTEVLGAARAAQVHVTRLDAASAGYLQANHPLGNRASFNHARALRSYHGTKSLLFMEDDVVWAKGSAAVLASWLAAPHAEALSLYNWFCERFPGASTDPLHDLALVSRRASDIPWKFSRTQTMVYDHTIARPLGQFMGLRLGQAPSDHLVDVFMRQHDASFGYAQPSMTQHIGRYTTGLGYFHESSCFSAEYPTVVAAVAGHR